MCFHNNNKNNNNYISTLISKDQLYSVVLTVFLCVKIIVAVGTNGTIIVILVIHCMSSNLQFNDLLLVCCEQVLHVGKRYKVRDVVGLAEIQVFTSLHLNRTYNFIGT